MERLYRAVLSAEAIRMVEVTDDVMAKINRQTSTPHTAQMVHVRGAIAANDQPSVDRRLRIERAALPVLAKLAIGDRPRLAAPVMRNHAAYMSEDQPVARLFDGMAELGDDDVMRLVLGYYWPRTPSGDEMAANVDAGLWREVSIGAYFGSFKCSICGEDADNYCEHAHGKDYDGRLCTMDLGDPKEFDELSFAWRGRLSETETFAAEALRHPEALDVAKLVRDRAERPEGWWGAVRGRPAPPSWMESMRARA